MKRLSQRAWRLASSSWVRWLIAGIIVVVAAVLTLQNQEVVTDGLRTLISADFSWVLISIVAVAVAMFSMAEVMVLLLRAAKVKVTRQMANSLTLAANAWSVTVPGGAAFSTALQIRRQLQWGATPVVVSWFVLFSGALSFLGLAGLGVGSLFFIANQTAPSLLVALAMIVLLATILLWRISQNPAILNTVALRVLHLFNKIRKKDPNTGETKVKDTIGQLTSVQLGMWPLAVTFFWSLMNWVAEVICLYAAVRAVGVDEILVSTVLLAFVTGKLAGFIQATPGGVGPVEALITGTLIASGMTGVDAFASVMIYRIVSLILVAAVGWVVYLLRFDHTEEMKEHAAKSAGATEA